MNNALLLEVFMQNVVVILSAMTVMWIISVAKKDASLVDIFWGIGFILVAWSSFMSGHGYFARNLILSILATLWGLRLSIYIFIRNWGNGEDPRYKAMRAKHGKNFWIKSFFTVFLFQGLMMFLVSLSLQIGQVYPEPGYIIATDIAGIVVWSVGFFFETVSDYQMYVFKSNDANSGMVMNRGLWRFSRHPNYFGEATMWWGIFIIAAPLPYGLISVISPILITFLLLKVSGVVMLEKSLKETKPEYKEYIEKTNAFIPWFPRK